MKNRATAAIAVVLLICAVPALSLAMTAYNQDFEALNQSSTSALADAGWVVYANVFGPDWAYWYGYGVFPAPNDGAAFCAIVTGEGGAAQGNQQMSVFSDYNNVQHGIGAHIESLVFHEQAIDAGVVGQTWIFDFQAKLGNLAGSTTAVAFIKTLNPAAGYATTNYIPLDMTSTPATWTDYTLSLAIDASLVGQLLQIGFASTATNYEGSGVYYDNVNFHTETVANEDLSWGGVKSLYK
ncbi:MAG: hypothetical protein Q7W56_09890 [Candidatus Latescibacteria bacterium]|nr:hypothetical protein [Candidatus Latescibacterota bacterium]